MLAIRRELARHRHLSTGKFGLVSYERWASMSAEATVDEWPTVFTMGIYEPGEPFPGTDKLSMAVQPVAVKFCKRVADSQHVLFEGDRLTTASFLEAIKPMGLKLFVCEVKCELRTERAEIRGASNQSDSWLKGRQTKLQGIMERFEYEVLALDTKEHTEVIARDIATRLRGPV